MGIIVAGLFLAVLGLALLVPLFFSLGIPPLIWLPLMLLAIYWGARVVGWLMDLDFKVAARKRQRLQEAQHRQAAPPAP